APVAAARGPARSGPPSGKPRRGPPAPCAVGGAGQRVADLRAARGRRRAARAVPAAPARRGRGRTGGCRGCRRPLHDRRRSQPARRNPARRLLSPPAVVPDDPKPAAPAARFRRETQGDLRSDVAGGRYGRRASDRERCATDPEPGDGGAGGPRRPRTDEGLNPLRVPSARGRAPESGERYLVEGELLAPGGGLAHAARPRLGDQFELLELLKGLGDRLVDLADLTLDRAEGHFEVLTALAHRPRIGLPASRIGFAPGRIGGFRLLANLPVQCGDTAARIVGHRLQLDQTATLLVQLPPVQS